MVCNIRKTYVNRSATCVYGPIDAAYYLVKAAILKLCLF